MIRTNLRIAGLMIFLPICLSAQSSREVRQWANWCRSIGGYVQVTQSNPICIPPVSTPGVTPLPSGPDPLEVERERLRKEKLQKAAEADQNGMRAVDRGSWEEAIGFFLTALSFAPDDQTIRAHLLRAQTALADTRSAQEMATVRQRIEDALAAAEMESFRQKMEVEVAVQQVRTLNESFAGPNSTSERNGPISTARIHNDNSRTGAKIRYPFSRQPISANSPAGKVLQSNQARIKTLDLQIRQAQKALRDLIKLNSRSEEERLEWTKQSEEATIAAEELSINLLLDLVDVRLDHQIQTNKKEQSELLTKIFSRPDSREVGVHTVYGMLLNHLDRLNYRKDLLRLAKKENDLQAKIRNFSMQDEKLFLRKNLEDIYDAGTQIKMVDDLAGPYKDLIDAAYTIYKQAASLEVLAITQINQERIYKASETLRLRVLDLVAERKKLSQRK